MAISLLNKFGIETNHFEDIEEFIKNDVYGVHKHHNAFQCARRTMLRCGYLSNYLSDVRIGYIGQEPRITFYGEELIWRGHLWNRTRFRIRKVGNLDYNKLSGSVSINLPDNDRAVLITETVAGSNTVMVGFYDKVKHDYEDPSEYFTNRSFCYGERIIDINMLTSRRVCKTIIDFIEVGTTEEEEPLLN